MNLNIFTDGGARGNPGLAATGWLVKNSNGERIAFGQKYLGKTTNNVAEYQAVLGAYEWLSANHDKLGGFSKINFYLDSRLVVSQLRGQFKIKAKHLMPLIAEIKERERTIKIPVFYYLIPRDKNEEADRLVNEVLDKRM